ncbi:flagellar attachment zone protein 1-like [Chaetodon trifascialis]|uniref:flagellar attachment zone protein 1-like n=1 Tax=Chaetodon trifascialis TaxID=109706 RepID=UPI003992DCAE
MDRRNCAVFTFVREETDESTDEELEEKILEISEEVGKSMDIEDNGSLGDFSEEHTPEKSLDKVEKDALAKTLDGMTTDCEDYDSSFEEYTEDESISSCSAQEKSLEKEDTARAQQREALEQEQKEKDALAKTLDRTRVGSEDHKSYFEEFTEDVPITSCSAQEKLLEKEDRARASEIMEISEEIGKSIDIEDDGSLGAFFEEHTPEKSLEKVEKDALAKTLDGMTTDCEDYESSEDVSISSCSAQEKSLEKEDRARAQQREALGPEQKEKDALVKTLKKEKAEKDVPAKSLKREQAGKDALAKTLKKEQAEKDAVAKSLKKEQAEKDARVKTLKREQAEKDARVKTLKREQAEKDTRVKTLKREQAEKDAHTLKKEQAEKDALAKTLKKEQAEKNALAKTLKKEQAEKDALHVDIKRLIEQQKDSVKKDNEIKCLHFNIEALQSDIATKNSTISSLQERLNQVSEHKEVRAKNCQHHGDYEAAVSQQQKEAELDRLTQENQQLASENKRLRAELEAALNEGNQLQEDGKSPSRLKEAIEKERAKFLRVSKKIQIQEKELSEKTLALEKSLNAETYLRSCLKKEQKRFEQAFLQKQAGTDPLTILSDQLKEAVLSSECLMYDMKTLRMENIDIRAKFKAVETEYNRMKSKLHSLSEHPEKMASKKNDAIPENQCSIAKLQYTVHELKALQLESKLREAQLKDDLKHEKTKNSELQQRVDQLSSALEKESTKCEKYCSRKTALDENTKALHQLQKEYTELMRRHSDVNSEYRELLRSHTSLKITYERLSSGKGNP